MTDPSDLFSRRDEIRDLMANNDSQGGVKKLMIFVRDFSKDDRYLDEVIVISANFRQVEEAVRRSSVSYTKAIKMRTELIIASLDLMRVVVAGACGGGTSNA